MSSVPTIKTTPMDEKTQTNIAVFVDWILSDDDFPVVSLE